MSLKFGALLINHFQPYSLKPTLEWSTGKFVNYEIFLVNTGTIECVITPPNLSARWQHVLWLFYNISVENCQKDADFSIISVEYCQILLICLNILIKYCSNWVLGWKRAFLSIKSLLASFRSYSLMKNDQNLQLIEHFLSMQGH